MPQSSDELRDEMGRRFGDRISEAGPIKFLTDAGYTLNRDWTWSKPGMTDIDQMSNEEFDCLRFLVEEWDFDGFKPWEPRP